jgi:hypothetical protein
MSGHVDSHLARIRASDLENLRWHWDEAYEITWDGRFRARRLDDGGAVDADTALELRQQIRDDYIARPVRRE